MNERPSMPGCGARRALLLSAALALALAGCGGSISLAFGDFHGDTITTPGVSITQPTSAAVFDTGASQIALGGVVVEASRVRVQNTTTGEMVEIVVPFRHDFVEWLAPSLLLVPGDNLFVVTADADGSGVHTSADTLTVRRPF